MDDSISAITTKACSKCKQVKELSMFYKGSSRNGRQSHCKLCDSIVGREYYKRNREKMLARQSNYEKTEQGSTRIKEKYQKQRREETHVLRRLLAKAKGRAKAKGLPFDLTIEWLQTMVISHCPITLQPIDWLKEEVANGMPGPNSPSIDKNIPELGYVQSNCSIVSFRGNSIKNNGTIDEHRRVVQYMAAQQLRDTEF